MLSEWVSECECVERVMCVCLCGGVGCVLCGCGMSVCTCVAWMPSKYIFAHSIVLNEMLPFNASVRSYLQSGSNCCWRSDEYKDFLQFCLVKNPQQRPTAKECLQHRFLKKAEVRKQEASAFFAEVEGMSSLSYSYIQTEILIICCRVSKISSKSWRKSRNWRTPSARERI